uniref:Uncharacterized protein n=1 Tax=Rhizophora mucronata TaxID=61149 RepID=A0A2P2NJ02_RHIMU
MTGYANFGMRGVQSEINTQN